MKELGYGNEYKYAHDFDGNFIQEEFLPLEISNKVIYRPQDNPREIEIKNRLTAIWKNKYHY